MNFKLKEQFVFSVVLFLFCSCALSFSFWPKNNKQGIPTLNDYPLTKVESNEYNFLKFSPYKQHNCK